MVSLYLMMWEWRIAESKPKKVKNFDATFKNH